MHRKVLMVLLLVVVSITALVGAQEITPNRNTEFDPSAIITWPPPVYVLRGDVEIRGSANTSAMSSYFIEFRPLPVEDAVFDAAPTDASTEVATEESDPDDEPWFPVTLPSSAPVTDDVLGVWNTRTTEDGLYELRLTVSAQGAVPLIFLVSPLRVENNPPDFVQVAPTAIAEPTSGASVGRPTLAPSPTQLDTTPRVTALLNANVRLGDSTDYEIVGVLQDGETVRVIGVSSRRSGWYFIELPDGNRGFIAPSVVSASGDLRSVPRIDPPPPPFTPTPLPTNTPVPNGNLAASPPALSPATPTCNVAFEILVNVTNNGTTRTQGEATILFQDVHVGTGQVQTSFTRTVPALDPGSNFVVGGPITVSTFFNEQHRIVVTLDSGNNVIETNEGDNVVTTTYTLQRGGC